jgi:hypothetical protein
MMNRTTVLLKKDLYSIELQELDLTCMLIIVED